MTCGVSFPQGSQGFRGCGGDRSGRHCGSRSSRSGNNFHRDGARRNRNHHDYRDRRNRGHMRRSQRSSYHSLIFIFLGTSVPGTTCAPQEPVKWRTADPFSKGAVVNPASLDRRPERAAMGTDSRDDVMPTLSRPTGDRFSLKVGREQIVIKLTGYAGHERCQSRQRFYRENIDIQPVPRRALLRAEIRVMVRGVVSRIVAGSAPLGRAAVDG